MDESRITRRLLIEGAVAVPLVVVMASCGGDDEADAPPTTTDADAPTTSSEQLPPTPACDDGDDPTPEQTEGPYFLPDSPERASLIEDGVRGDRLVVTGRVLGADCKPVPRALLDFWQADGDGEYDVEGFRLRGHQFTDSRGRFRLETVVPGLYPGRTRHIHVKAQRPRGQVLTTQLYFQGEAQNESDGLFDQALLMAGSGGSRRFDFVLA